MRLLPLLLVACTGTPVDTTDPDPGTETDSSTTDVGTETDTERTDLASFSGVITDEDAAPIEGARISVCRAICRTQQVDATGTFDFQLEPDTHSIHVEPPHAQAGSRANALFPLTFGVNEVLDLPVVLPALATTSPLPVDAPGQLDLDGVVVTAQAGDLAIALNPDPVETLGGVRLDPAIWPPTQLDGEVIAMWYLSPYNAYASAGMPVSIHLEPGLATDSEALHLYRADYNAYAWVDDGEVIASTDGTTLQGTALLQGLTTLALVRPLP